LFFLGLPLFLFGRPLSSGGVLSDGAFSAFASYLEASAFSLLASAASCVASAFCFSAYAFCFAASAA